LDMLQRFCGGSPAAAHVRDQNAAAKNRAWKIGGAVATAVAGGTTFIVTKFAACVHNTLGIIPHTQEGLSHLGIHADENEACYAASTIGAAVTMAMVGGAAVVAYKCYRSQPNGELDAAAGALDGGGDPRGINAADDDSLTRAEKGGGAPVPVVTSGTLGDRDRRPSGAVENGNLDNL
jgi:hypothetical protein